MRVPVSRALVALMLTVSAGAQAFVHDESVDGDLSGDRLVPTWLTAVAGSNTLAMSSAAGDRDYVGFTVPAGWQLSSIFQLSYDSTDNLSFIALQAGTTLTEPPTGTNAANLLGWYHFGAHSAGSEIIDDLAASGTATPPAMGFTAPLGAGPYTFWIQQTSVVANYAFDFVLTPVPEPATPALALLGGLALAAALRRPRPAPR
jgi:hypothetical protein